MRNHHGLLTAVMAAVVLQGQCAHAQDDEDEDERGDRDDARNGICSSSLGGRDLRGTLNVTGRCELSGADVRGDVVIFAGGSLVARDTRIRGSLEASRADFIELDAVRVDRNVSLQELVGDSSRIASSDLRGNVALTGNRSRFEIVDNAFRNDLGAFGNTGGMQIAANDIGGDLTCTGNTPAPTVLGNRIDGDALGQCGPRPQPTETPPPPQPTPAPMPTTPRPAGTAPPPTTPTTPSTPTTPTMPTMPTTSPPPTPEPAAPPPTAAPPPPTPAAATPPAAAEPPQLDDGGAGAAGWPLVLLLLPLAAWRRFTRAREARGRRTR